MIPEFIADRVIIQTGIYRPNKMFGFILVRLEIPVLLWGHTLLPSSHFYGFD